MDCVLKLNALVFDEIIFKRNGMRNNNELELSFTEDLAESPRF